MGGDDLGAESSEVYSHRPKPTTSHKRFIGEMTVRRERGRIPEADTVRCQVRPWPTEAQIRISRAERSQSASLVSNG